MPSGGYRKPSRPAAVSGPGKLSRRTDGGPQAAAQIPAAGKYGDRKAMAEMQSSAPMAGNPVPTRPSQPVTEMFAPTQRPGEPVTAGSIAGLGPGPEAMNLPPAAPNLKQTLQRLASVDETGQIDFVINSLTERGL